MSEKNTSIKNSNLSDSDIKILLKDFDEVKKQNYKELEKGDEVVYFLQSKDKEKSIFRKGGYIKVINLDKGFLILSNAGKNWSVQLDTNSIYKRKPKDLISDKYENEIKALKKEIQELKSALKKLFKENQKLKNK